MAEKDDGYIRFRCKACGQRLKVKDTFEGGDVIPCPRCGIDVNVPIANIEEVAKGTDMPETGQPGRLNIDPELLRDRLRTDVQSDMPGSLGAPPSVRSGPWTPDAAFGRIDALDNLASALATIEQETMGTVQRIYRDQELSPDQREEQVKDAADQRREQVADLLRKRLAGLRAQLTQMDGTHENPTEPQQSFRARTVRAIEALRLYGRHVLGIEPRGS
jgi:DNA-directed RNA polymerase subunit RPC12/RpoP